ncbi:hypothetical protein D3C84_1008460 [compost metagenome]
MAPNSLLAKSCTWTVVRAQVTESTFSKPRKQQSPRVAMRASFCVVPARRTVCFGKIRFPQGLIREDDHRSRYDYQGLWRSHTTSSIRRRSVLIRGDNPRFLASLLQTPLLLTFPIIWKSHESQIARFLLIHDFCQAKLPLAVWTDQVG